MAHNDVMTTYRLAEAAEILGVSDDPYAAGWTPDG